MPKVSSAHNPSVIIREQCEKLGLSQRKVAEKTGIHPAYFSRVLLKKAHFSDEQLFRIGTFFRLKPADLELFLLKGRYSSCASEDLRDYLLIQINNLEEKKEKLTSKMQDHSLPVKSTDEHFAAYYDDPSIAKVHMGLTIPKLREDLPALQQRLGLSKSVFDDILKKLELFQLIALKDGKVALLEAWLHLDEGHPLSRRNHVNWRHEAINKLWNRGIGETDYHASVVFTADANAKKRINRLLKETLTQIGLIVKECRNEDKIYYVGFDLF